MVGCAALLCVPMAMKSRKSQENPALTVFHALSSGRISVKVSGDVSHPGIYEIGVNSLAVHVINMAEPMRPVKPFLIEGHTPQLLNGSAVNLLITPDGSPVLTVGQMTVPERLILNIPLDIASMSEMDFGYLPGIGAALAQRIVMRRQKNGGTLHVEELATIEGIGDKKYTMLRNYFQGTVNRE